MQWKWKAWLQTPQATLQSSDADAWFAWHSMQASMMWLRQMAQLSTTMSHAHSATALYFLISNRGFFLSPTAEAEAEPAAEDDASPAPGVAATAGSTPSMGLGVSSAIACCFQELPRLGAKNEKQGRHVWARQASGGRGTASLSPSSPSRLRLPCLPPRKKALDPLQATKFANSPKKFPQLVKALTRGRPDSSKLIEKSHRFWLDTDDPLRLRKARSCQMTYSMINLVVGHRPGRRCSLGNSAPLQTSPAASPGRPSERQPAFTGLLIPEPSPHLPASVIPGALSNGSPSLRVRHSAPL